MVAIQAKATATQLKTVARFRKKADGLTTKIESKLTPREMNTKRKFAQAMKARSEGQAMLQLQAALLHLAGTLESEGLDYPLSTVTKPQQLESLLGIATRLYLDGETIERRGWQYQSKWTSQEVIADCDRHDSSIGELYSTLELNKPEEMLDLLVRLRNIVTTSGCIDWNAEELIRLRAEVRLRKIQGFVPTPPALADELIGWLCLEDGDRILEPAAGDGAILEQIRLQYPHLQLQCCEINSDLNRILGLAGYERVSRDYFDWHPEGDERPTKIAANPPFENLEDIDFVLKMWGDLAPGGRIATIMSNSFSHSSRKKAQKFRNWLLAVPKVIHDEANDADAFKPSGYSISTRLLVLEKPLG